MVQLNNPDDHRGLVGLAIYCSKNKGTDVDNNAKYVHAFHKDNSDYVKSKFGAKG